jgi:hypothetical protein
MEETEHLLKPTDRIYDLVDVIDAEDDSLLGDAGEGISVGGQVYEKTNKPIGDIDPELNSRVIEKVSEIAEKVAREIMPDIAERVIREEIENLKREYDQEGT